MLISLTYLHVLWNKIVSTEPLRLETLSQGTDHLMRTERFCRKSSAFEKDLDFLGIITNTLHVEEGVFFTVLWRQRLSISVNDYNH